MPVLETLKAYPFDGRAGELQRQGATAALVRELGDNYPAYHGVLVRELAARGRPERHDFSSPGAFLEAYAEAEAVVSAEIALRACRAFRLDGRPLDAPLDFSTPLLDAEDRLVDVERP